MSKLSFFTRCIICIVIMVFGLLWIWNFHNSTNLYTTEYPTIDLCLFAIIMTLCSYFFPNWIVKLWNFSDVCLNVYSLLFTILHLIGICAFICFLSMSWHWHYFFALIVGIIIFMLYVAYRIKSLDAD